MKFLSASFLACASCALERFEFAEGHMGSPARIVMYCSSEREAVAASKAAFAELAAVDAAMSDYKPESELSRFNARAGQGDVPMSAPLLEVLRSAQEFSILTDGAFDVTVGPLVLLWRKARKSGQLPDPREALAVVGYEKLVLGKDSARLEKGGMKIDVGGIAKGYAADRALARLGSLGIRRAFIAAGGDFAIGDPPPEKKGWRIQVIDGPVLLLSRCGVSTSGDSERFVEIDGRHYSHIVNPRTGIGLEGMELATVVAENATATDALATAVSVLGPKKGLELIEKRPGTQARVQWREEKKRRTAQTAGFAALVAEP